MFRRKPPVSHSAAPEAGAVEFASVGDALRGLSRGEAEAYISARTRFAYLGNNRGLAVVLAKYKMHLDTTDQGFAPHMIFDGYWEYWLTRFLADHIKPGDSVCDIGANMGYYSVLMSELVGHQGQVHCFEPNPRVCELLQATLNVNGFAQRAKVHGIALSESDQADLAFFIPHNDPKNARLVSAGFSHPSGQTISVRSRSIDSLNLPPISFIKIDVEGAELQVLRGLQALKDAYKPRIVCEVNFGRGYSYDDILALLGHHGELQHVDYWAKAEVLTREMAASERINEDWLVYYPGG